VSEYSPVEVVWEPGGCSLLIIDTVVSTSVGIKRWCITKARHTIGKAYKSSKNSMNYK